MKPFFDGVARCDRTPARLQYDPATMKVTNIPEANELLTKSYRKGWEVREG